MPIKVGPLSYPNVAQTVMWNYQCSVGVRKVQVIRHEGIPSGLPESEEVQYAAHVHNRHTLGPHGVFVLSELYEAQEAGVLLRGEDVKVGQTDDRKL
ncbi:hypothetical protein [Candidatus Palauibacter sp.]|uniref:hypothetical protein n=1 Tax=Candidatus Palauibacter sp. TaxID=3101350 RepID=UPI003B02CF03